MSYSGGPYDPSQLSYPGGAPGAYPGGQGAAGSYPGGPGAPGGYPGGPGAPGGYPGGYPGGAPQPAVSPEVRQWFDAVDQDRSGRITAQELQGALVNGNGKNFNMQVCNLMVGMFDRTNSGTIDIDGFQHLYRYVNQWLETFRGLDRDQSGVVDSSELSQAFTTMGYRFTPQFVDTIVRKADPVGQRISVDQFILLCIQIQKFTDAFKARDREMRGEITIGFEDFLTVALSCT